MKSLSCLFACLALAFANRSYSQETAVESTPLPAISTASGGESRSGGLHAAGTSAGSLAEQIATSCKFRERRMMAIYEAMLKLREADDEEEATRLENRLLAMVETRDPREDDALVANKTELLGLKKTVTDLTTEIGQLREVLEANCKIIDQVLGKAVPDISPGVLEELKNQAKKQEVRKVP